MTIETTGVRHAVQATTADLPGASVAPAPDTGPAGRRSFLVPLAIAIVVFGLALGLRLIGLGGAVTEDEDQWIARSGTFARALATHDWPRTYLTGHPGVTTMWLTTLALGPDRAAGFAPRGGIDVTVNPDFLPALRVARVPFAVVQALLVIAIGAPVARLLGSIPGLVTGLLLAAEPFWAGVGPIVGMDGLLSGLLTVSLLTLMLGLDRGAGRRERLVWTGLSGLAFGLAFLTKTTALLAGPLVPALAIVSVWKFSPRLPDAVAALSRQPPPRLPLAGEGAVGMQGPHGRVDGGRGGATLLVVWGGVAALTVWLVWPAAWASPLTTVLNAFTFSAELGSMPHGSVNFFLGQPIEDPGPAFYPVALALRLGPGTTIGLLLLLAFGARPAWQGMVWRLLGFALVFVALLTLSPKKVDRYLLPILPALGILAALGWIEGGRRLAGLGLGKPARGAPPSAPLLHPARGPSAARDPRVAAEERGNRTIARPPPSRRGGAGGGVSLLAGASAASLLVVAVLALGLQVWPLIVAGRYPLAAYNPLFGGSAMAERAIPLGWGDGLDVAGDLVRQLADGPTVTTAIWSPLRVNFGAHNPGPVVSHLQIDEADFYVDYVHARQRRLTPRQLVSREPDAVVTINGVDYARIYRLR